MKIIKSKINPLNYLRTCKVHSNSYSFSSSQTRIDDLLPEHLSYKIPKFKRNINFDFPWLINGAPVLDIKSRLLPDQIFTRNSISRQMLLKHLFKIYRGVLLAKTQFDYDFLKEYCEEGYFNRVSKVLNEYERNGYSLELLEDMKANNNQRINPELHLYDNIIIKGLSINRKINGKESDYSVCNDIEDMGFLSYLHKSMGDAQNFTSIRTGEDTMIRSNFKTLIFRSHCMFKSGLKLFVYDKEGKSQFEYGSDYNFNHVAVFECQMQELQPLKSFEKAETYTEWIAKHNFGVWKMIDLDNWMKGNNYFI